MLWLRESCLLTLITTLIRLKFSDVTQMMIVEFAQELENATQPQPLILDVRGEAEYAVSHLTEAKRMDVSSDLTISDALKNVAKDTQIVLYCSVGYRSAKVAQQLQQAGFQDVFNLEGGLFQWANEGRPIVHAGQLTQFVHPYRAVWGMLLKKQYRFQEK